MKSAYLIKSLESVRTPDIEVHGYECKPGRN